MLRLDTERNYSGGWAHVLAPALKAEANLAPQPTGGNADSLTRQDL